MKPAHRPSQRAAALDAALDLLRTGARLSLDSAARAAGLSKPGLMYHFPTKEALVVALVDHLVDDHERTFVALLPGDGSDPSPRERIDAYLEWSVTHAHDAADLVALSDPGLREVMAARWAERFRPWLDVPTELPADERARLQAVRLLADGCWLADATDILPVPAEDRAALLATARRLLAGGDA
ncbi:TetR/AcrR family transcriptional regulator [Nocardioides terrigena]|uniref:TetR/AcrR family transcriptional regulator n=1 Tax=Nocardioides terrigena TaxID=424797 RepID=UPI000D317E9B|nr:TetR/AcrR family transcriptional regulator [Nocardioides terrigena]